MPSLKDAWARWRNRRLGDPAFRHRLQRLPLLRGIARRRARELFDINAGFVNSQVLAACLELDLFTRLAEQPEQASTLAGEADLDAGRLERLLEAAAALALLEPRSGGRWGLGPQGAVLASDPGMVAMSHHHRAFYEDLADPVRLLRGANDTRLSQFWPYAGAERPADIEDADTQAYTDLMAASQRMVAEQVLSAFDFEDHRALLDVGGGSGAFLAAVGRSAPSLELGLFDLPGVVAQARTSPALADLGDRVHLHGGDFHRDALPEGYDLVSLVRIAHDHDDEPVAQLFRRVFDALPPGGTVLVAEPMVTRREGPSLGNYFRFYLMAMGSGRPRTPRTLKRLLRRAGFRSLRRHGTDLPLICRVISARKPGATPKRGVNSS